MAFIENDGKPLGRSPEGPSNEALDAVRRQDDHLQMVNTAITVGISFIAVIILIFAWRRLHARRR